MGKIVDQSECRIQAHMDQRAHIQYQTDISQAQARGTVTRGHTAAEQSNRKSVGPIGQSADHPSWPTEPQPHRLTTCARTFVVPSLSRFQVPRQLHHGQETPSCSPYKYERGVRIGTHQVEALAQTLSCVNLG